MGLGNVLLLSLCVSYFSCPLSPCSLSGSVYLLHLPPPRHRSTSRTHTYTYIQSPPVAISRIPRAAPSLRLSRYLFSVGHAVAAAYTSRSHVEYGLLVIQ